MNVAQLLDPLARAPHIEVIETLLPDRGRDTSRQRRLCQRPLAPALVHLTREALLDHLHHNRGVALLRLTHQQVEVFGHDHVAVDYKLVLLPRLFQYPQKQIAAPSAAQLRLAAIATAGDEVQVMAAVEALQSRGHDRRITVYPRFGCDVGLS